MHRASRALLIGNGARVLVVAIVFALALLVAVASVSSGFSETATSFGQDSPGQTEQSWGSGSFSDEPRPSDMAGEGEFSVPVAMSTSSAGYFFHYQPIKLMAAVGVSVLALVLLVRRKTKYRKIVLLGTLITLGFLLGGFLCPLAAVQNVMARWNTGYLVLFLAVLVVPTLLAGRVFCGWVCPFGAAQELLHIGRLSRSVPSRIHRYLVYVPYGFLLYLILSFLVTGSPVLLNYTPFKAVFAWDGVSVPLFVTVGVGALSVFVYRPFCQYACPLGALLGLISRVSIFGIRVGGVCTKCGRCQKVCPVDAIEMDRMRVRGSTCIVCGKCSEKCPKDTITLARKTKGIGASHPLLQ